MVTVVAAGGLLAGWWPVYLMLRAHRSVQAIPLLAHVCGMLAGYGVLVMIALMSRHPALEQGIGGDVLARWHARGGRAVVLLVGIHAWAAVTGWGQLRHIGTVSALWGVLEMPFLMTTTLGTVLLFAVAGASIRAARRAVSFERWHGLHLLTYVSVALAFLHQLAGPDLAGHRVVQVSWALLYVHVFWLAFRHRLLTPLRQASRHRLRVAAVVPEAPGVASIVVEGQHLGEMGSLPGQFFRWRFLTPDLWASAHPFSLSAPPTDTQLRLTVKALGDGTTRVQEVPVGTWVVAEGPYGALTAAKRMCGDVLLIAGGVGITPMRALFETIPVGPGRGLTLVYRARFEEDLVFRAELEAIAAHRPNTRIIYIVGDAGEALTARGLQQMVPGLADHDVYLCGPPGLSAAVRLHLRQAGVPSPHIHEESFS